MSASLDLPDADWVLIGLTGAWAREAHVAERPLVPGRQAVSSARGASGAQHNPFLALRRPTTDEAHGEAYGFSLVYSGNFLAEAEVDAVRHHAGPDRHRARDLRLGASSPASPSRRPRRSSRGAATGSAACPTRSTGSTASGSPAASGATARGRSSSTTGRGPTSTSTPTGSSRSPRRRASSASSCSSSTTAGSGPRNDDTTSLGDWFVDRAKLPDGLDGVAKRITALGLDFGLWIEPEMVSADSELFRAHPDWAIGIPGRPRTESRQQLVLDMGRAEVVDHLDRVLGQVLESAPITYIKWDMNRNITEPYGLALPPERQGEFFHRYILGVYELYRRLTTRFPNVLFESCASGGARFDPGMLAFAPQGWTSDDTDAIERLRIQWGTSLAYPLSSMGAHVSAVPEPPDRAGHADLDPRDGRVLRGLRLRAGPDPPERRRARRDRRAGRVLRRPPRPVPARPLPPAREPVRGRPRPGGLDDRGAGSADRGRRLVPGPPPAVARTAPAAAARPRPGGGLPRVRRGPAATTPWRGPTRASGPARS